MVFDDAFFANLKREILSVCPACNGSGFLESGTCDCMIEFRARHRLLLGNFASHLLDVDSSFIEDLAISSDTKRFVDFFLGNSDFVRKNGLSLYIWSESRGVGKTTLSHVLTKYFARHFAREENYRREINYRFMEVGEFCDLSKKNDRGAYQKFIEDWDSTLFVLDDFGNEDKSTSWSFKLVSHLMQDFLRHRTRHRLPTIITSNTRPIKLREQYTEDISTLLELQSNDKIGGLLWREVKLSGKDLRLDKNISPWKVVDGE